MSYRIILSQNTNKFLNRLDEKKSQVMKNKLKKLAENPELGKPLVGRLSGLWSLRIDKYRAIYSIKESQLIIFVIAIGHRKEIYRFKSFL